MPVGTFPACFTEGGGVSTLNAAGNDIDDIETTMAALVAGWKFTDMVSIEAGWGYREDSPDGSGFQDQTTWNAYVQLPLVLAPGVYVIPEFGYYDSGDTFVDQANDDAGSQWYLVRQMADRLLIQPIAI